MRISDLHKRVIAQQTPLILDRISDSVGAYSLRKLRNSYNGACIRVRRSSDNAEQDIGFVNNQLDTSSLLSFVGSGSGFVKTWYDQSSLGGSNAFQNTNASQPRIVNNGVIETSSGKPSINFLGSQWFDLGKQSLGAMSFFADSNQEFYGMNVFRVNVNREGSIITKATADVALRNFSLYFGNFETGRPLILIRGVANGTPDSERLDNGLINYATYNWNSNIMAFKTNKSAQRNVNIGATSITNTNINIGARTQGQFLLNGHILEIIVFDKSKINQALTIEQNISGYYL
jgi:hypothetical protein